MERDGCLTGSVGQRPHAQILQIEDERGLGHEGRRQVAPLLPLPGILHAPLHEAEDVVEEVLLLGRQEDALHVDGTESNHPNWSKTKTKKKRKEKKKFSNSLQRNSLIGNVLKK